MNNQNPLSRSREHFEVYLTRVNPGDAGLSEISGLPIEKDQWLSYVESDEDLNRLPGKDKQDAAGVIEAWGLQSHPGGTPLYYDQGVIRIDRDDSVTIKKMVEIAAQLNAYVIAEDGQVFSMDKTKPVTTSAQGLRSSARKSKVILEDERIRRKQCLVGVASSLIFPALVAYWWMTEFIGPIHIIGAIASMIAGGWFLHLWFRPKYFIEKDANRNRWLLHYQNTSTTEDRVVIGELDARALPGLELVWFFLDYPAGATVMFHVRGVNQPWLVLQETQREGKAKALLQLSAKTLVLNSHDRTNDQPATDIPKRYLLKPEEKKPVAIKGQMICALVMLGLAALLYNQGTLIFAVVFLVLAMLILIGLLVSHFRTPSIPEKYRSKLPKPAHKKRQKGSK